MDDLIDFLKCAGGAVVVVAVLILGIVVVVSVPILAFGDFAVPEIRQRAEYAWEQLGYSVVGYEGFQYDLVSAPGGCVWYMVKAKGDDKTIYSGCLGRWWNGEIHLYNMKAINALTQDTK